MTKILAIDDNNDNLITLQAIIKESFPDLDFETALSGKKGIELAISTNPDVIFLDIIMPDMDGHAFIREVRKTPEWNDVPIIVLTAEDLDADAVRGLKAATDDVIQKGSMPLGDLVLRLRRYSSTSAGAARCEPEG